MSAIALVANVAYDASRLVAGLAIAALALGVAAWIVRTTDWRPPSEAGTPELDDQSGGWGATNAGHE
jgi:hypothetical protein